PRPLPETTSLYWAKHHVRSRTHWFADRDRGCAVSLPFPAALILWNSGRTIHERRRRTLSLDGSQVGQWSGANFIHGCLSALCRLGRRDCGRPSGGDRPKLVNTALGLSPDEVDLLIHEQRGLRSESIT